MTIPADRLHYYHRGASAAILVVALPLILAFTALAVDVGLMYSVEAETQSGVDAAALAGAAALWYNDSTGAVQYAQAALSSNLLSYTASGNLSVVDVGRWNETAGSFTANHSRPNAVRVTTTRLNAPLFFAAVIGQTQYNVTRSAIAVIDRSVPCKVWGIHDVKLHGGGTTDSYDSTEGAYGSLTPGSEGHVCSCKNITLSGTPTVVHGEALYGSGYSFTTNGGSSATGGADILSECINPTIDFTSAASSNNNGSLPSSVLKSGNRFELGPGDIYMLASGTYYFSSMELKSNSTLLCSGATTIYVTGDIDVKGHGMVNASLDPWNLTVYCGGSNLHWSGDVAFYGSLQAPNADVKITGHGDFYGAVIAGTLDFGGHSNMHVDESLPVGLAQRPPPALVK